MVNDQDKLATLIKLDADRLHERITLYIDEAISLFAVKRDRTYFKEVFFTRYKTLSIHDLAVLSEESVLALENFYHKVFEIIWYLNATEDMPNTLRDKMQGHLKKLDQLYNALQNSYLVSSSKIVELNETTAIEMSSENPPPPPLVD